MKSMRLQTVWMSILFGALLATSPHWLDKQSTSNYEAPWIHPAQIQR